MHTHTHTCTHHITHNTHTHSHTTHTIHTHTHIHHTHTTHTIHTHTHTYITHTQHTQLLPATTKNDAVAGCSIVPGEHAVREHLQPYLSTNRQQHRDFTRQELATYPYKDMATFWLCENYPKVCSIIITALACIVL